MSTVVEMVPILIHLLLFLTFFADFRDTLVDKRRAHEELRKRAEAAAKEFKQKKNQVKALLPELQETAPLSDENGDPTPFKLEMEAMEHDSTEEYEAALDEAEQKVKSIHNDPNAIKTYQENLAEIDLVEKNLELVQGNKDSLGRKIQQELSSWKAALQNSIDAINAKFVGYMSELSVTGEVRLKRGGERGNEDIDFKNWGIEIKVSFREGVKAQVLSAQVQ